jgi:hypothetical protein
LLPTSLRLIFQRLIGTSDTTINQPRLPTKYLDDADSVTNLLYHILASCCGTLLLPATCRRSRFPRLIGMDVTINQPLVSTYLDDADPDVDSADQPYTHQPSLYI